MSLYLKSATVGNNSQSSYNQHDFLQDKNFIRWRLFQTNEWDEYWANFLIENPDMEEALKEAIIQFDAVKINRELLLDEDKKQIYGAIQRDIHRYKKRRLMRRFSSAAAVLVIGIVLILFFLYEKDSPETSLDQYESITGQTLPEEDIYLITGGERVTIASKSHIGLTGQGKALITDSTNREKELLLAPVELNRLVVPYGKRTNLTLADGTEVWLNSGTQLDFPSEFMGDKREIYVNGEIFINVAHNSEIPFVVHAQDLNIHVQGTSFNISAYKDDHKKTVVLVEGKVKIESAGKYASELLPNEKIEIVDNDILKETVNVSEYISWTKGMLEFDETPVSEILRKIGRYYNVRFESSPEIRLNDKTCSGKLFLSNNLDSVMRSVSVLSSTIYRRENNIIHITKK